MRLFARRLWATQHRSARLAESSGTGLTPAMRAGGELRWRHRWLILVRRARRQKLALTEKFPPDTIETLGLSLKPLCENPLKRYLRNTYAFTVNKSQLAPMGKKASVRSFPPLARVIESIDGLLCIY